MKNNEKTDAARINQPQTISDERINRFGERLKVAMNGESNNAFAKRCGWSERVIRNYLSGNTYPAIDKLATLANHTGRSIEWLVTGESFEQASERHINPSSNSDKNATPAFGASYLNDPLAFEWQRVFERMTPKERNLVLDHIARNGIKALMPRDEPRPVVNSAKELDLHAVETLLIDLGVDRQVVKGLVMTLTLPVEDAREILESSVSEERLKSSQGNVIRGQEKKA